MLNPNQAFRSNLPPLKKIWNREYAVHRLTAELALARQTPGYSFSILLVHLDGFSSAGRERLGFASGNDVAPHVLAVLTEGMRETDACCHLADEEFLLVLPHRTDAECRGLAGLLKQRWAPEPSSRASNIVLRAGWASASTEISTVEKLFAAADESLSRAYAGESWNDLPGTIPSFETTASRAAAQLQAIAGES